MSIRRTAFTGLSLLATTLTLAGAAHADEHAEKAAQGRAAADADLALRDQAAPERVWYGWQILPLDVAAIALGSQIDSVPLLVGSYSLGAPLVHWAHGHRVRALVDFGVRATVPLTVSLVAGAHCEAQRERGEPIGLFGCDGEAMVAAVLPALGISLLDMVFSLDERGPATRSTPGLALGVAPRGEGGVQLSFGGAF